MLRLILPIYIILMWLGLIPDRWGYPVLFTASFLVVLHVFIKEIRVKGHKVPWEGWI